MYLYVDKNNAYIYIYMYINTYTQRYGFIYRCSMYIQIWPIIQTWLHELAREILQCAPPSMIAKLVPLELEFHHDVWYLKL